MQIHQLFSQDANFPAQLREIPVPPSSIYTLGEIPKGLMVAIVGTRNHTDYGRNVTYRIAGELARAGFVIVSGLALGIDGIAHRAALDAGGKTVAVLANGLDRIYPATHRNLAMEILSTGGAIISEYAVGTAPLKHHFLERNRLVAGLAEATIVTESGAKGGSITTANEALMANRLVLAVPGDITRESAAGPNNLLRSGAIPITSATDVLQALDLPPAMIPASVVHAQNPHEAKIIELLKAGVASSDDLLDKTKLSAAEFASIISLMEITGKIRNLGAGQWSPR